jgi:general secretion pathway protein M
MSAAERAMVARIAALGILVAIAVVLWLGPVGAYRDLVSAGARELAGKEQLLDRYRALVAGTRAEDRPASDRALLFPALSDAGAAALLQETLKAAATSAQVEIQGIQMLPSEVVPGAQRVGVRLRGSGDIAGLNRLLYAIEASRPLLYTDNLQIQSRAMRPAQAPAALDFQFDVAGFKPGPAT